MSSPSPHRYGETTAVASSSRTSPIERDESEDGLDIGEDELLADDPLHEHNGGLDGG